MVLFKRKSEPAVMAVTTTGAYDCQVVGEATFQDNLIRIFGRYVRNPESKPCNVLLVPEPTNQVDALAVRVDIDRRTIGYLSKEGARKFRRKFKLDARSEQRFTCAGVVRGGWKRGWWFNRDIGLYGVWLDLPIKD